MSIINDKMRYTEYIGGHLISIFSKWYCDVPPRYDRIMCDRNGATFGQHSRHARLQRLVARLLLLLWYGVCLCRDGCVYRYFHFIQWKQYIFGSNIIRCNVYFYHYPCRYLPSLCHPKGYQTRCAFSTHIHVSFILHAALYSRPPTHTHEHPPSTFMHTTILPFVFIVT